MYIQTPTNTYVNYCPHCGTKNNSYNYCPKCGKPLSTFTPLYPQPNLTPPWKVTCANTLGNNLL